MHSMMFIVTLLFAAAFKVVLEALDSLSKIPGWVLMATWKGSAEHKGLGLIKHKSPAGVGCLES